jgi:hypothetical protein
MQLLVTCFIDSCNGDAFYCQKDRRCIRASWKCNYGNDCSDGEDEEGCRKE